MSNQKDVKILSWTSNQMDVRLVVGPDHYHPTHLHVKDTAELLRLLAIDWKILYADESHKTDLGQRIGDAIYGWNEQWSEEDNEAYPKGWRWLGIVVYGYTGKNRYGKESYLNWGVNLTDRYTVNINLDQGEIEGDALRACQEVYESVAPVLGAKTELDEG